jgi:hypothetical protein
VFCTTTSTVRGTVLAHTLEGSQATWRPCMPSLRPCQHIHTSDKGDGPCHAFHTSPIGPDVRVVCLVCCDTCVCPSALHASLLQAVRHELCRDKEHSSHRCARVSRCGAHVVIAQTARNVLESARITMEENAQGGGWALATHTREVAHLQRL